MRLTNKYHIDEEGNMIGYTRYRKGIQVAAEPFHGKLKIVHIGLLNTGCYFELQDEQGKTYSMNDIMFEKYIDNNDVYIEGNWKFYQQGTAFSIGE